MIHLGKTPLQWIVNLHLWWIYRKGERPRTIFKKGDRVRYNWKARAIIGNIYLNEKQVDGGYRIVDKMIISDLNVQFTNGDSCSTYWVSKCKKNK